MSWASAPLREHLAKLGSGITPRGGSNVYVETGTALIRSQNIYNNRFEPGGLAFINESQAEIMRGVTVCAGDVLLNITGDSVARCCQVPFDVLPARVNQHVMIIRPKPGEFDARYLAYQLTGPFFQSTLLSIAGSGGTRKALTKAMIERLEMPRPEIQEQQRIAAILSAYDDLIDNNRRRIELLEEAARQLYKEWFVRFRFPGHEHGKIIDGVPEGWSKHKITDVWDISYGKNLPTSLISDTGTFPVHGADGIIGFYGEKNVDQRLCLITCRGAGSGNVRRTFGPTFVTNNCLTLKPKLKADLINFHFAIHAMTELKIQELKTGAAQPQITIAGIGHVPALVPSHALLDAYNVEVDPIFDLADLIRLQNDKLAKARDLLLPRLMNGSLTG